MFPRQEPKKRRLADRGLSLDMPILFEFERRQLLLWLVEFQEDKAKFSIYKVLMYATGMAEAHPDALVVPVVLFTDRKRWRKDVKRQLDFRLGFRVLLRFEYLFVRRISGIIIPNLIPLDRAGVNSHATVCRPYRTEIAKKCPVGTS